MGQMIELKTKDGQVISAYRAKPADKPRGGLVVIQEIWGVNSHIRNVADGYAADGYLVIAPALFDRNRLAHERTPGGVIDAAGGRKSGSPLTFGYSALGAPAIDSIDNAGGIAAGPEALLYGPDDPAAAAAAEQQARRRDGSCMGHIGSSALIRDASSASPVCS